MGDYFYIAASVAVLALVVSASTILTNIILKWDQM